MILLDSLNLRDLNNLILDNFNNSDITVAYKFNGINITQKGNLLYSEYNPSMYLPSFKLIKFDSFTYKLSKLPSREDLNKDIVKINSLIKLLIL